MHARVLQFMDGSPQRFGRGRTCGSILGAGRRKACGADANPWSKEPGTTAGTKTSRDVTFVRPRRKVSPRGRVSRPPDSWRGQQTSRVLTMLAYCSDGAADATTVYEAAVCAARAAELAAVEAKAASEASCTLALATALRAAAEADARAETAEVRLGAAVQDATLAQRSLASERQLASRRAAAQQATIGGPNPTLTLTLALALALALTLA